MKKDLMYKSVVAAVLSLFGITLFSTIPLHYQTSLTSQITQYAVSNLSLTGAINVVYAMLLDFRAYDTLGEILVIFVSISGIMFLIGRKL
jgi:multisubunit Na+/H+ antiporter MnhB subunit